MTTTGLARMNMTLHDFPTASIMTGNTLSDSKFKDGESNGTEQLRTYDYVVANPPFSVKTWSTGLTPANDPYQRFAWGEPPAKQGDYAFLLHIIRSMKGTGKGACTLPHGVLFRGWTCDLIPKPLIVARYFAAQQAAIEALQGELDAASASQTELEEEQAGDEGIFSGYDSITAAAVKDRIREIGNDRDGADELKLLKQWLDIGTRIAVLKKQIKDADAALDKLAFEKYSKLTEADAKSLVIDDKWIARLAASVQGELDRVSQTLTGRIRELPERYATPLPQLTDEVAVLAARVAQHIERMGATWS